jgi:hypothetical protein
VLILLGAIGGVVSFILARRAANNVETQIAIAASGVALGASALSGASGAAPTAACASAIACCKLTVAKTAGANAPAIEQACAGLALLSDVQCAQQSEAYKRAALALGFTCP